MKQRWRITTAGAVQGVGFRPYVYRAATAQGLHGWVCNTSAGVLIEVEGEASALAAFAAQVQGIPEPARLRQWRCDTLPVEGGDGFRILPSAAVDDKAAHLPLDQAPCSACINELFTPTSRRYLYPFITCAACGPRYTILHELPFDRERTAMESFPPCAACSREHAAPADRRFHAVTISCPSCGPRLTLRTAAGDAVASEHAALEGAAKALRRGAILALKGIGGWQLLADARCDAALTRLRAGKARPSKALAVLFATPAAAEPFASISPAAQAALVSAAAPIVLLPRRAEASDAPLSSLVAPKSPYLGAMLPASPLHHLLSRMVGRPLVATSANRGGDPLHSDDAEAMTDLGSLADLWLGHDRAIVRRLDDAVVRLRDDTVQVLRLGRGYGPLALPHHQPKAPMVLALGGQEKNAFALTTEHHIVLSPHVGDLDTPRALACLTHESEALARLLGCEPRRLVLDPHPDYLQHRIRVRGVAMPPLLVQHHHAHALAAAAEHGISGAFLAFAWDGSGYGTDGTVWGGEILRVEGATMTRLGHLQPFSLPGGEAAVREPRRAALGMLLAMPEEEWTNVESPALKSFAADELAILRAAWRAGINAPRTSSVGRLFDAVASMLGLRHICGYAEEAAVAVEDAAQRATGTAPSYHIALAPSTTCPYVLDWRPMVRDLLLDQQRGLAAGAIARGVHTALAAAIARVAAAAQLPTVVLTGGVFQNALLTSMAIAGLRQLGLTVHTHAMVPSGDGGLAVGQALYGLLAGRAEGGR